MIICSKRQCLSGIILGSCLLYPYDSFSQVYISLDVDAVAGIQNSVIASPGDMISASIVLDVGASGVSSYGISLQFDTTELNLVLPAPATELLPAGFSFSITAGVQGFHEDIGGGLGDVLTFEAATFGMGPVNSMFEIGQVHFVVTTPTGSASDIDIRPGFFNMGIDAIFENNGIAITPTITGAAIIARTCDFDEDGMLDVDDIDLLRLEVKAGTNNPAMDLNEDRIVNADDIFVFVTSKDKLNTYIGDSNLNGEFNTSDMVDILTAGQYEDGRPMNSTWSTGDWDGDGDFSTSDLVFAFQKGGYEEGPRPAVFAPTIPEPSAIALVLTTVIAFQSRFRLRCASGRVVT